MSTKVKKKPGLKNLRRVTLRPAQIQAVYGIPQSTLHYYCTGLPAEDRLPSLKLPGRCGTRSKGTRMVFEQELLAWLEKYRAKTQPPAN